MKNILIYRTGSLGDTIVSLPAIQLIKKINPDSKIYYLYVKNHDKNSVSPSLILKDLNLIDEFFEIENITSLEKLFKSIKILKKYKINKLYYLNEDRQIIDKLRDYLFFKLLLKCNIFGINFFKNNKKFYEGYYLANKVKKISFRKLIKLIDILSKKIKLRIKYKNNLYLKNYITISPGGRIPSKRWHINNWRILIKKIICRNQNIKIIILGTKSDQYQNKMIGKFYKKNILDLTGKTTLKEIFLIINNTDLHVCHDDGTMHIAALLKKKVLCLFHNIDFKEKWFKGSDKNTQQLYSSRGINKIKIQNVFLNYLRLIK